MARTLQVVTPENIPLTLEMAGIGTRFGAFLLDALIQCGIFIAILIIAAILSTVGAFARLQALEGVVWGLVIFGVFLLIVGYPILFETIWNGQTPGKRVFRLRVIQGGGYPVTFFGVATRNLMRIADFVPFGYIAGALAIFFSAEYRRLGDMVAGTLVIKEKESDFKGFGFSKKGPQAAIPTLPPGVLNPYDVLAPDELNLLRRFAVRRWNMTSDDSERVAYRLVAPLVPRLGITFAPDAPPRYADLATVLAAAAERREAELAETAR